MTTVPKRPTGRTNSVVQFAAVLGICAMMIGLTTGLTLLTHFVTIWVGA